MKNLLKLASLIFAAGLPSALAIELAGASLPAALDPAAWFGAFVTTWILLTAFADYSRRQNSRAHLPVWRRAKHPLAA